MFLREASYFPEGFAFHSAVDVVLTQVNLGLNLFDDVYPDVVGLVEGKGHLVFAHVVNKPIIYKDSLGNTIYKDVHGKDSTLLEAFGVEQALDPFRIAGKSGKHHH